MIIEKYYEFMDQENKGMKDEAKQRLSEFINSFSSFEEKEEWTYEYLSSLKKNHLRIRHELYESIIFPVLLYGFRKREINAMHWIVKTRNNLFSAQELYKEIDYISPDDIMQECHTMEPFNSEISETFLGMKIDFISYSQHEWPSGILYGANGASLEECYEIKDELMLIRNLDQDKKYEEYLNDYELKLELYIERLKKYYKT